MPYLRRARRTAAFAGLSLCAGLLVLMAAVSLARAHSGYDALCCSDRDCAPIDPKHVTETEDGFTLRLGPNDHAMLKESGMAEAREWFVPRSEARRALDFDYHACFSPNGKLLCFYQRGNGA